MTSKRVVVCSWSDGQGAIAVGSEEALSLGRKVAEALDSELRWLVLGPQPEGVLETAGRFGVAGVDRIEDAALEAFARMPTWRPWPSTASQESPALVLFSQAPDTRLVAPRLAGRLGAGVVMNGRRRERSATAAGSRPPPPRTGATRAWSTSCRARPPTWSP